jgi:energy-coupling factor transporter ATP-binding protein EcfA2
MSLTPPLVELDTASFSYPESTRPAVDCASLSIRGGEYLAVVGENGSGKSSLLRLMDALLLPDSGTVRVSSMPSSSPEGLRAARSLVSLVFQSPPDQIVSSTVEEDVAFGPENLGLPREEIRRRVGAALATVGLEGMERRATLFLSAGQQQRLAIAAALAVDARCIAFDEATAMLDPEAAEAVLDLMDALVASGKAVVHATHDMAEAARAARVIVLRAGAVAFDGSPAELFEGGETRLDALGPSLRLPPCARLASGLGLRPLASEGPEALAERLAVALGPRVATASEAQASTRRKSPIGVAQRVNAEVPPPPAFELRAASHAYLKGALGETPSLMEVDLEAPRGKVMALVGRTGSGKSTALQLLDGLVAVTGGEARAFGESLGDPRTDLRAMRVRAPLAMQRPESALFERYAADDVAFGPRNLGLKGAALVERVSRAMSEAGLPYDLFRDRRTRALSGGEKRRLALAGVIAMEGEALLLDEPTSALDPETKLSVMELVLGKGRRGSSVVMATHSMEEAAMADLVAVFDRGRIAAVADPETLFYDLYDPAWGIRRPFAVRVAIRLAELGFELAGPSGKRPLRVEELARAASRAPASGRGGEA